MNDDTKFFAVLGAAIIMVLFAFFYGGTFLLAWTYRGQQYDVTATVQAVELSTRFGEHTNIKVLTYGEPMTYNLIGHHTFEVGTKYRIVFVDKIHFNFWAGFFIRGEVKKIEVIPNG